ncbi:hypothetical protein [Achromobacter ruhlandii]|uniref:hypothetical protein n=1 Tax=Achromobacter ruhlandii TaxID=72557 RepID=UPI0012E80F0F|nr:hypothetical protein [Achromobacter ruhlandii]
MKTTSPSSERSGWRSVEAFAAIYAIVGTPGTTPEKDRPEDQSLVMRRVFDRQDLCGSPPAPAPVEKIDKNGTEILAPFVAPVVVALVTAAISYWGKHQTLVLKEREKATKNDTEAQIVMSPEEFQHAKCVVYIRRAVDPLAEKAEKTKVSIVNSNKDLVIVLKVVRPTGSRGSGAFSDHFYLVPVYVNAPNSIALTGEGKSISLAVGVTLHQVGATQGIPTLASLGMASTAIPAVPLKEGSPQCIPDRAKPPNSIEYVCRPTAILPLPLPTADGTIVLGIGVQEIGNLGFDVDLAEAQIEAIAAALGPLAGTLLADHFKRARVRDEK